MTMPARPVATSALICFFTAGDIEPVSSAMLVASSGAPNSPAVAKDPSIARSDRAC
ncbi:Uncharacterised protein [Mycobacteroides abscessus subsp. abscessus]|nr:Uncharacterised protein [Mycobacteroides abscessus subsp. abscessus]SKS17981.1 Uncharacterised protein [Mycobacteroides abscessus subsp. abscessus]SKU16999.1 Uncharacterised protein [Mycobacteroides abscessus subsp. abscessus]